MGRTRYKIFEKTHPHFLTCTIINWLPIFTRPETTQIILDSFHFLQKEKRLTLFGYVILENHLHLIASSDDLNKEVAAFKSFTARKIIDYLKENKMETTLERLGFHKLKHKTDRQYQLWQEGSHPQQIQGEEMMKQKLEYIHLNPVKRGYIDDPIHWRYSSARNYAGKESLIDICTDWFQL